MKPKTSAVLGRDDALDGVSDLLDLVAFRAFGERLTDVGSIGLFQHLLGRGIGAVDRVIEAADDDVPVLVELDDQTAEIGVLAVGRDDQRRVAVRIVVTNG